MNIEFFFKFIIALNHLFNQFNNLRAKIQIKKIQIFYSILKNN